MADTYRRADFICHVDSDCVFRRDPDAFAWLERPVWEQDEQFCRWFWSWAGVTPEVRAEIESILD
jgi:hypothetical protein